MAKNEKAVSGGKASPPNEFFRGDEKIYDGGKMAIVSPVGSVFDYPISRTNAMDSGLAEQGAGKVVGSSRGGKK